MPGSWGRCRELRYPSHSLFSEARIKSGGVCGSPAPLSAPSQEDVFQQWANVKRSPSSCLLCAPTPGQRVPGLPFAWRGLRFLATPLGRTKQSQLLDSEHSFCFDCRVLFFSEPKTAQLKGQPLANPHCPDKKGVLSSKECIYLGSPAGAAGAFAWCNFGSALSKASKQECKHTFISQGTELVWEWAVQFGF